MNANDKLDNLLKTALNELIARCDFDKDAEIKYDKASETGDGYIANHLRVNIQDGRKELELFVKYSDDKEVYKRLLCVTECNFYRHVAPVLIEFEVTHGAKGKPVIPICYKTFKDGDDFTLVILENLKEFKLYDRRQIIDEKHLYLILDSYARFHAVSFAMKQLEPEKYRSIVGAVPDFFPGMLRNSGFLDGIKRTFRNVLDKLNGELKRRCDEVGLYAKLVDFLVNLESCSGDYCAITHGDTWINNVMFKYDSEGDPVEVRFVDFQSSSENTPVHDLLFIFYTIASKEHLDKLDDFLDIYHRQLLNYTSSMGGDSNKSYPKQIFLSDWKLHGKLGLGLAVFTIKMMLLEEGEVPESEDIANICADIGNVEIKRDNLYMSRVVDLLNHFIDRDFI